MRRDDSPEKDCEITGVGSNPSHKPVLPKFHPLDGHQLDAICKSGYWLTDIEVNAAQALLHQQFPEVDGFQDTCLSQGNFFQPPRNEFIQIFNVNQSHWIALSTVGCPSGHVNVYDSLYRHLHSDTRSTIASLLQSRDNVLTVVMPEVQKQSNGSDCGVYAIAFSTAILNGIDVKTLRLDSKRLRPHLRDCLEKGEMCPFPTTECKVTTLEERTFSIEIDCLCRQPNNRSMKNCKKCSKKTHIACLWQNLKCDQCQ